MSNDHFTIGKASVITNISERRLRYYDQLGLCSPAYRDPNTGYRYYTADQIPQLMWISYMRSLDMPVQIIAEFFKVHRRSNHQKSGKFYPGPISVRADLRISPALQHRLVAYPLP